jgi:hypothetical protein
VRHEHFAEQVRQIGRARVTASSIRDLRRLPGIGLAEIDSAVSSPSSGFERRAASRDRLMRDSPSATNSGRSASNVDARRRREESRLTRSGSTVRPATARDAQQLRVKPSETAPTPRSPFCR